MRWYSTSRIDLLLRGRAVGSRTKIKDLIRRRKVCDDNGNIILSAAQKVSSHTLLYVDGQAVPPVPLLALYHKPVGVLSVMGDSLGRPNLQQEVEQAAHCSQYSYLKAMHPVGRLDSDTSGLLLFSSNGVLTNLLLQPQSSISRVYEAVVTGLVDFEKLKRILEYGVKTANGTFPAILLECNHIRYDISLTDSFKTAKDLDVCLGNILSREDLSKPVLSRIRVSVVEGKHRMVRRLLHNAGHSVVQLKRVSYGDAHLNDIGVGKFSAAPSSSQQWAWNLLHPSPKKGHFGIGLKK